MMKSVRCVCVVFSAALSCFGLSAAQQGEIKGNVYEMNVEAGGTVTMNADDVAALGNGTGAVTELHKVGDGTLVAASMSSFAGTIRISGGVYSVPGSSTAMFGTSAGPTIVEDGATVLFTGSATASVKLDYNLSAEPFQIAGKGFEGQGVLRAAAENGFVNNVVRLGNLTLTDDVLLVGISNPKSNFFYFSGGYTFDMGGFTLDSRCTGNTEFQGINIVNPGHFISSGSGVFVISSNAKFNHGPEHTVTVNSAVALDFYNNPLANPFNWTVVCAAPTSKIAFYKNVTFDGNVVINAGCTCSIVASGLVVKMMGNISGDGNLQTNCSDLYLCGTNTYTGTTSGGTVYVASPTAIPDFSKCTSGIGGFVLSSTADGVGIKSDEFEAFATGPAKSLFENTSDKVFLIPDGGVVEVDADINSWNGKLYNKSNGTVAFTKAVTTQRDINFYHTGTAGGFRFSNPDGDESRIGKWTLNQGRMELFDANLFKSNNTFVSSATGGNPTWLVISNTLFYGKHFSSADKKLGPFYMGNGNADDTIEVLKGSVISNSLTMGVLAGASSAFYLRDGFFALQKNYNADCAIGEVGMGYFEQSGGACEVVNHCHLGHGPGSYGLHYMTDGTFKIAAPTYNIGQSGNAAFYQNGGTFTTPSLFYIGSSAYDGSGSVSPKGQHLKHVWTLEGENAQATCSAGVRMSERNNTEDTINLNDGAKLTTTTIYRSRGSHDNNGKCLQDGGFYTNDFAYVNFNGGILRATASNFLGWDETFAEGRGTTSRRVFAKVYEGGATIEVTGYFGLSTPLEDASGKGVKAIPMPEDAVTTGLNAPPYVNIVGDGSNATAVATFDSKTQTWTGIKVTSPGFDYTWAKAEIVFHGTKAYEVDCELADNKPGPVHFIIDKTAAANSELNFSCAHTYTGPTRISGGRIWFNTNGSLASRDITVDADANLCTAACINGANVHGGGDTYYNWHTAAFTADGDAAGIRQASGTLTIDANPVITLKNLTGTDQNITVLRTSGGAIAGTANLRDATFVGEPVPEGFKARVSYVNGEVIVKIREIKGSLILVR